MAELATIARPYADALYQSAGATPAQADATNAWLQEVATVASEPQLRQFADNPKVSAEQVFSVLAGVVKTPLDAGAQNFLRTVIENGRLSALPAIAAQFRALANARAGSADAVVHSAFPLDASALAQLQGVLEQRFGRKLQLTVAEDASLIGGVRVVVGDEVLDTSVRARLDQMKTALSA